MRFFRCISSNFGVAILFAGVFYAAGIGTVQAQTGSGTRLHQIDQLCSSHKRGSGSTEALADLIVGTAYSHDLAGIPGLPEKLSVAEAAFAGNPAAHGVTDADVVRAFDAWRTLISDPNLAPTSPYDLFKFRESLIAVAPFLVTKNPNGIASDRLSPVEAVYLFDFLIANGKIPKISKTAVRTEAHSYDNALDSYLGSRTAGQRQTDLATIINSHILKY